MAEPRPRRREPLRADRTTIPGGHFAAVALTAGVVGVVAGVVPDLYVAATVAGLAGTALGLAGLNGRRTWREGARLGTFLSGGALVLGLTGALAVHGELDAADLAIEDQEQAVAPEPLPELPAPPTPPTVSDPEVDGGECTADADGTLSYQGTARNTSTVPMAFEVTVTFVDQAGNPVGESADTIGRVGPDADTTWAGTFQPADVPPGFRCQVLVEAESL